MSEERRKPSSELDREGIAGFGDNPFLHLLTTGRFAPASPTGNEQCQIVTSGSPNVPFEPDQGRPSASFKRANEDRSQPASDPEPGTLNHQSGECDGGLASQEERDSEAEYHVGYGKPPLHTRFTKGRSGNPGGKTVGTRSHVTLVREILNEKIVVTERGKPRKMSRIEFVLRRFAEKAMKGDPKSLQVLLAMLQTAEASDVERGYRFTQEDQSILASMADRLERRKAKS